MADSEVNEYSYFQNINLWHLTTAGAVTSTGNTLTWSNEPTGIAVDTAGNRTFTTNDDAKRITEVNMGPDGLPGTADDTVVRFFSTLGYGNSDPEDVAYDTTRGWLHIADGTNREVFTINPGPNGIFDGGGDDIISQWDTAVDGVDDPEGIAYHAANDTLTVVDYSTGDLAAVEYAATGGVVRQINLGASNALHPAGATWAPASNGPGLNLWVVDRGIDGSSPRDGKLVEMAVPPLNDIVSPDPAPDPAPDPEPGPGPAPGPEALIPLVPARLLDTRSGNGVSTTDGLYLSGGRAPANSVVEVEVLGRGGVVLDAEAVMVNVTAVFPDGPGFVTVFPCGTSRPTASNVNYRTGDVVPNAVLAKVGDGGRICLYTLTGTDLVVDVNGYVPAGGSLRTFVPARLMDTRSGDGISTVDGASLALGRVAAGSVTELVVAGRGGVDPGAESVLLNVTAVLPGGPGFVTVFPCGAERPTASNVNYFANEVTPNAVLARVGAGGKVCLYSLAAVDLVVDVSGFVPQGGALSALLPARLLDTRIGATTIDGVSQGAGRAAGTSVTQLVVAGRGGVPANASAVILNVTAVFPDGLGFVTVYPCGVERPIASNVNYFAGDVTSNAVLAKVGTVGASAGRVCLYSLTATDLVVDVNGYVPAPR